MSDAAKILNLLFLVIPLTLGCLGGDHEVRKQDTADLPEVFADSVAVKDTTIIDSIRKQKAGQ